MTHILKLVLLVALSAGAARGQTPSAAPAKAKAAYCQDATTHKRISCKTAAASARGVAPAAAAPAVPAKKPSMMAAFMKPKAAASTPAPTPMQSPAPTSSPAAMATGGAPHCTKGKVCGHSCIAPDKICHKPS